MEKRFKILKSDSQPNKILGLSNTTCTFLEKFASCAKVCGLCVSGADWLRPRGRTHRNNTGDQFCSVNKVPLISLSFLSSDRDSRVWDLCRISRLNFGAPRASRNDVHWNIIGIRHSVPLCPVA